MGFVFAMNDRNQCLFQWKQGNQVSGSCTGLEGMQVKVMDLDDNEEVCDFWGKEKTPKSKYDLS